jgi:hypothetical protein
VLACKSYRRCVGFAMLEAEEKMREYLRGKTLAWLHQELAHVLPEPVRQATRDYFSAGKQASRK